MKTLETKRTSHHDILTYFLGDISMYSIYFFSMLLFG